METSVRELVVKDDGTWGSLVVINDKDLILRIRKLVEDASRKLGKPSWKY